MFVVLHTLAVSLTFFTTQRKHLPPPPSPLFTDLYSFAPSYNMHYFAALVIVSVVASSTLAAPFNETLHTIAKRDLVCGANFRDLVDFNSCLPNQRAFTLTLPSTITSQALAVCTACFLESECNIWLTNLHNRPGPKRGHRTCW